MEKSVSCCCVRGRRVVSNPVTYIMHQLAKCSSYVISHIANMYSYIHKALCMYTGQLPAPENVSACVTYKDNDTLLNVQWDVSVIYM